MSTLLRETNTDLVRLLSCLVPCQWLWNDAVKLAIRCGEALLAQHGPTFEDVEEFARLKRKAEGVLGGV